MPADARDEVLDLATAEWLVDQGAVLVDALVQQRGTKTGPGRTALAEVSELRGRGCSAPQAGAVVAAASARIRIGADLALSGWPPDAAVLLSTAAAEQGSHPLVSAHRARRFGEVSTVVDLGCGAGLDAIALALAGPSVTGIDLDEARLVLAGHNAGVAGAELATRKADVRSVPVQPGAYWHADPGRRTAGHRARNLAQTVPPSGEILQHVASQPGGALVMGPGVAWDDPDLPETEVEFIQVGGVLTEAVAWVGDLRRPGATAVASSIEVVDGRVAVHQQTRSGPAPDIAVGPVGRWLLDPEPAAARARVHHALALEVDGHRIEANRALCTSDRQPAETWFQAWEVEAELPGRPRSVRTWLRGREALPVSIQLHGTGMDVDAWWHGLGSVPRGPRGRRIHVVQGTGRVRAIVTRHASLSHDAPAG